MYRLTLPKGQPMWFQAHRANPSQERNMPKLHLFLGGRVLPSTSATRLSHAVGLAAQHFFNQGVEELSIVKHADGTVTLGPATGDKVTITPTIPREQSPRAVVRDGQVIRRPPGRPPVHGWYLPRALRQSFLPEKPNVGLGVGTYISVSANGDILERKDIRTHIQRADDLRATFVAKYPYTPPIYAAATFAYYEGRLLGAKYYV